jgi:hypothetical protein
VLTNYTNAPQVGSWIIEAATIARKFDAGRQASLILTPCLSDCFALREDARSKYFTLIKFAPGHIAWRTSVIYSGSEFGSSALVD